MSVSALISLSLVIALDTTAAAGAWVPPPMPSVPSAGIDGLRPQLEQSAVPASARPPANGSSSEDVAALIDALDQKVRALERRLEEEQKRAQTARPTAGASADGFVLRSTDDAFTLRLRGLVHSDGRFYGEETERAAADAFLLRRVRPIVDVTMFSIFDARLTPDFGEGKAVVQDAYVDARLRPALRLRAGKMKAPLGIERLASSNDLLFVERGLPTALVPNRDLGVMAQGDLLAARLLYQVGVFNGVVDGASSDVEDGPGKDVVARLFVTPFRGSGHAWLENLGVGVAGSHGTTHGTLTTPALPNYKSAGQLTFFRYRGGTSLDTQSIADGGRDRISTQATYYAGQLTLLAEQVRSSQDVRRGIDGASIDVNAWQLAASWVLTGEAATGRSVRPRHPFDAAHNSWGALEITGRVNALRVDDDAFPVFADPAVAAQKASGWAIGANWYLNRTVKVTTDYERTAFTGGAAAGADRPTEHVVFTRLQFGF
jgi:phosphate-selective porin OprO/OprP